MKICIFDRDMDISYNSSVGKCTERKGKLMNDYEKLNRQRIADKKVLKVGAYCRVSTDKDDQANSFESQQRYFKEYIERNPDWELYEIFADDAVIIGLS